MIDILTEIVIHAPLKKVSGFASDPDNAPVWYGNIKSVEWETPKPLKKGSFIAFKAKILGMEITYTYEIIKYIPEIKLIMRTAEGSFPMETTYTWESINSTTTRMTLRNSVTPSGFSKLFAPFMKHAIRKENQKDLKKLKSVVEGI